MLLEGKIALVTGCKRSIGYDTALTLAENGADMVLNDVAISEDDDVVKDVRALGRKAIFVSGDVSKEDDVKRMMETIKAEYGRLDILINNAGITRDAMAHKMTMDQWNQVIAVNLTGTFLCAVNAMPIMQEGASIVNLSSVVGSRGSIGQANYVSTKAGVQGLTKTLALEFAKKGIRVNAIAPGFIDTPMTQAIPEEIRKQKVAAIPLKRMGNGRDIANGALFLVSPLASYITGITLHINGGTYPHS